MSSNVSICNQALTHLGADTIMSLTENTENARRCNVIFEQTRNEVLRGHPWNFAMKRASLAALSTTPSFEWAYEYQLPTDCLRVLAVNIKDTEYRIEGKKLLTDNTGIKIRYTYRVEDPVQFDANFTEAMAAKLAAKLAYPITESKTLADTMIKLYNEILSDARSADAQEGTPEQPREGDWVDSRSQRFGSGGLASG